MTIDIDLAERRLADRGLATPLAEAPALSRRVGRKVYIKAEYLQPTGSFKVRGALNAVLAQADLARERGVVTFSTGNHGRALAWAAAKVGAACTVFVSNLCPPFKRSALEAAGARLIVGGAGQDEAEQDARDHAQTNGAVLVPPFNDPLVIAGQGTMIREIVRECPDVASVIVPVSGGGLASGIALAAPTNVRLIGVTMERGAAMHASIAAGRPVDVVEEETLADSLGGGVGGPGSLTFSIVRDRFHDLLLVSEEQIAAAMVFARRELGIVLEGAGATPIALALDARTADLPGPIVLIATGGNVDPATIDALETG